MGLLLCACLLTGPAHPAQQLPWQDYQAKAKAAFENGHLADAEQFYSAAISEGEKARAGTEDISALLSGLAAVYAQLCKPDQAAQLYRKSLHTLEKSFGPDDPRLIQTMLDLGSIYESEGNHAAAMDFYNRVFVINKRTSGENHPAVAKSLQRIAVLHSQQGKYAQAQSEFKQALSIMEKAPIAVRTDMADLLDDYADHLKRTNETTEAAALQLKARTLRGEVRQQSTQSPNASESSWKAQLRASQTSVNQSQVDQAQRILNQAQSAGSPDRVLSPMFSTLAEVYYKQSRFAESEPLYRRSIAIDEAALGPDHPGLATDLQNLALLYIAQEKFSEAEPLLKRALSIYQKAYGQDNLLFIRCQSDLATVYENEGNISQAESLYRSALATSQKILGPNHIETARLLNNLAYVCYRQGKYSEAETLYKWALASSEAALPPDSPLLAGCIEDYSRVLRKLNKTAEAEQLEARAKTILANQSQPGS